MGKPNGFVIAFLATIDHRLWVFNLAVQRHPLMTLQAPMFAIRSVGLFVALPSLLAVSRPCCLTGTAFVPCPVSIEGIHFESVGG